MAGFFRKILGTDTAGTVKKIQYYGNAKTQEGIPKLIEYMDSDNVEIRRAAAAGLEHHWMTGNPTAIAVMTKALDDADAPVRKTAAIGLGEFISKAAGSNEANAGKQRLIELLKEENDESVIKSAILGLGYIQDGNLITPMAEALKSKDKKIISLAIDAIGNLPETDLRAEMKRALRSIL